MNKPQKHILILLPGFAANENDSSAVPYLQVFFRTMLHEYPQLKFSIITFQYPYEKGIRKWNGIDIYDLGGRNRTFPKKLFLFRKVWKIAKHINDQSAIDVIHSYWIGECTLMGNFIARKLGIEHNTTAMGQDVLPKNKYLKKVTSSKYLNSIFTLSEKHKNDLLKQISSEIDIVPFGLNAAFTPQLSNTRPIDVLGVGSFSALKNFERFIEVIENVVQLLPDIKVLLIGGGEQKLHLETLIKEKRLENNLSIKEHLPHQEVISYMNQSKVLLHTSQFEGMGYVLAEAMFMGMKVVSTPVGHQIDHPRWVISDQLPNLVDAILKLLLPPFLPERVEVNKIENTCQKYLELWQN